jgi:hypothetical protein
LVTVRFKAAHRALRTDVRSSARALTGTGASPTMPRR